MGWGRDIDGDSPIAETRVWFADGENLAEGGIVSWLEEMRPYLENQGVKLSSLEDVEFGENYRVSVNSAEIKVGKLAP